MKAGIVGAGIMGQLLAFELTHLGWDVTLFDPAAKNNCSMAAAGLLTPVAELEKNDLLVFQLGIEALSRHWPDVLARLPNVIYFKRMGSLILSHPNDQAELLRFIQIITAKMDSNKLGNYQQLTREQIIDMEPDIVKGCCGYFFTQEGQIDNQQLLSTLENYLFDKVIFKKLAVQRVEPYQVLTQQEKYHFDWVFDCRGLGARDKFIDLRSIRGELIWLHAPDVTIHRPVRLFHPRYNLYLVPRAENVYLLGASEIESEDYSAISVRTVLELLTAAYYMQPKLAEARIIKTMTHCRPTLANHLPRILYSDRYIAVNGLYRHGFLIGPTLAKEIIKFIQHGKQSLTYPQLWNKPNDHDSFQQ